MSVLLATVSAVGLFMSNSANADTTFHKQLSTKCGMAPNHTQALNDMGSRAIESSRYILSDLESIAFENFIMSDSIEPVEGENCAYWITDKVLVRFAAKDLKECVISRPMTKSMLYRGEKEMDARYTWGESSIECKFPESLLSSGGG